MTSTKNVRSSAMVYFCKGEGYSINKPVSFSATATSKIHYKRSNYILIHLPKDRVINILIIIAYIKPCNPISHCRQCSKVTVNRLVNFMCLLG